MSIKPQRYDKEWSHLPSVTEVIDVISKPQLIYWLKNTSPEDIKKTSDKSLNIGKVSHEAIGRILNNEKFTIETEYSAEVSSCVKGFIEWKKNFNFKVIECELKIKSDTLGYKGTLDHILENNGKKMLIDWKTSKSCYPEYDLQVVAYKKLYEEQFGKIDSCWIIRLGKENSEFEAHEVTDNHEKLFDIFKAALQIKLWQMEIKK